MPTPDHDAFSMQLLSSISEVAAEMPPLGFTANPAKSRNAADAMAALICHRLSPINETLLAPRSDRTYNWRGGVFNSRNITDRDYFWTNMRRGVAEKMHDNALNRPVAYLFACAKPGEAVVRLWAIPEPIFHDCLRGLSFEEKGHKYSVEISPKKQRIERCESSPYLAPYFRAVELLPEEALALDESRKTDERAKEERRRRRESSNNTELVIEELTDQLEEEGVFDPNGAEDARDRILASVVRRRGQPAFRELLLSVYNMRCAISGCDVVPVLEAAHITPYLGPHTNRADNGLLLRADLHTLFDLKLIAIDADSMTVLVAPDLSGTFYNDFRGLPLKLPAENEDRPSSAAIRKHREESGL
ncbi:MAG: HNH endonuclease [Planctomycetes bacterium]|nr:HNH endonuclease [Planctomycetota bacterium]